MEIANHMKKLTQDILSSSEERADDLTRIREEANTLRQEAATKVKEFSASRGEASRQLTRDLSQNKIDRKKEVTQSLKVAKGMVQDFHDTRHKAGEQLRKDLVQSGKQLVQNEKKRKQEVGKMLEAFQVSHKTNSAELKKGLAEGKAQTQAEVKESLADARTMINSFQSSRQTMAADLKNELDKARDERQAAVSDLRRGFHQIQTETKADLEGAAKAWQGIGPARRKKSGGAGSAEDMQAEASTEKPVEAAVEMPPNLEEKLVSIINQHTEGITLSEIAKELGLVTIVLGKAAKVLLEQGKVRREEKIYFPVTN
jgi:hypothetical protein